MANKIFERDTGKDCPYCGGVIYAHVTKSPAEERTEYHNCKMCGANWSADWSLTRPSNIRNAQQPQRYKANPVLTRRRVSAAQVPNWVWMIVVILGALLLVRLGIFALFGPVLMIMTVFILGYICFLIGKERQWW